MISWLRQALSTVKFCVCLDDDQLRYDQALTDTAATEHRIKQAIGLLSTMRGGR